MKLLLVVLSLLLTAEMMAETRYVSDSLTIFIRTGPTHQFRIVGTLESGAPIEVITDDVANNATQIRLASGREVWVDTEQLMSDKPAQLLLEETKSALQQLRKSSKKQISDMENELRSARELASRSQSLLQQIAQLEYDKELLEQKNQTLGDRSRYDLLTAGGIVALAGLILGLILPRILRRKRSDGWS